MITHVMEVRELTETAYILRAERGGLDFEPGQSISLGRPGSLSTREYTVYSGPREPYVEVLIKVVEGGLVSGALRRASPGDALEMSGPFGRFLIPPEARQGRDLLFVATGTGVSPFHCFVASYPMLSYRLLHGVRAAEDLYERQTFARDRTVACVSRGPGGDYPGRVTGWLASHAPAAGTLCYLCGNSDMIYDVVAILRSQGIPREQVFAEVYF